MLNQGKTVIHVIAALLVFRLGGFAPLIRAQNLHQPDETRTGLLKFELKGKNPDEATTSACLAVLIDRLNPETRSKFKVSSPDQRTIFVEVLDKDAAADSQYLAHIRAVCEPQGLLEFRILAERGHEDSQAIEKYQNRLDTEGTTRRPDDSMAWFEIENPVRFFFLNSASELKKFKPESLSKIIVRRHGDHYYLLALLGGQYTMLSSSNTHRAWRVTSAKVNRESQRQPCLQFTLDSAGGELLAKLTQENKSRALCIFLDGRAVSYATVMGVIRRNAIVHGSFGLRDVQDMARILSTAPLPGSLRLVGLQSE